MGANAGPDIVSDGLVLALDAADNNSFRGEPTINVINGGANRATVGALPIGTGTHAGISRTLTLTSYSLDRPNVLRYTSTNNTGYSMLNQQFSIQNQSGTTYTYSFEYKQLAGPSNSLGFSVVYPNGYKSPSGETAASSITNTQIDLEDGWKRWILTYTCNNTGYNYVRFNLWTGGGLGTQDGDFDFYFDNFMLQEGSERTRFVDGTRGTTVATGGGWKDISGNDNHGEILNGTSTSNDGSVIGALDFDGTNDYLSINTSNLNNLSEGSVEFWFKSSTTGPIFSFFTDISNYFVIWTGDSTGFWSDESIRIIYRKNGTYFYNYAAREGNSYYADSNWHHCVFAVDSSGNKLYTDGSLLTVEQWSLSTEGNSSTRWLNDLSPSIIAFGRRVDDYANVEVSLARIYNRALSASEVLANYNFLKTRFGL
jgi:hypothetical protein